MNKAITLFGLLLLSFSAHATGKPGLEGFMLLLVNNFLLAGVFFITLILSLFKFFNTPTKRNIALLINSLPLLFTVYASLRFFMAEPELNQAWLIIPAMLLGHIFCLIIPWLQYKALHQHHV